MLGRLSLRHRQLLIAAFAIASSAIPAAAKGPPVAVPADVLSGIDQFRRAIAPVGDLFWPGFAAAPAGFLYVDGQKEVLLCDERVPQGFMAAPRDARLDCAQAVGPKSWRNKTLLAAMPAFGPPSLIVMGAPGDSGRSMPDWVRTVVHEHFHQWQSSQPDYYGRVGSLNLADGDETGMWMLNYAFPYADAKVDAAYRDAARQLLVAIDARPTMLRAKARDYWASREKMRASVSADQWRYYDFQLWQEGVARWTEIVVAEASSNDALVQSGRSLRTSTLAQLRHPDLAKSGRESVYPLGAGEAMLLERLDPDWRGCYRVTLSLGECFAGLGL